MQLYHYRARMYDAGLGRFCSRDPIGFEGSEWGLYEYVNGRSLVAVDPSGLIGCRRRHCKNYVLNRCDRFSHPNRAKPLCWEVSLPGGGSISIYDCNCHPKCKPCNPGVGTIGWKRTDATGDLYFNKYPPPGGFVPVPHMHVMQVNQRESDCKCFWNAIADVVPGSNRGNMPDANIPVTGGGA